MSVKEIENASATQIHTNKYIEHVPNKTTITSIREKGTDKYKNAHMQAVAIEFSRRRDREPSTLRIFCRLKVCTYKRARQSRQRVSSNSVSLVWFEPSSCLFIAQHGQSNERSWSRRFGFSRIISRVCTSILVYPSCLLLLVRFIWVLRTHCLLLRSLTLRFLSLSYPWSLFL